MKLSQVIAPAAFAVTTGLTATAAMAQATACVNDQCVTGSGSASIRQDGTYILRDGVRSGTVLQPVQPAQPYRHQPIQPAQPYRPQAAPESVAAARPIMNVYSFDLKLHGPKETWLCNAHISNASVYRDLTADCASSNNLDPKYRYNTVVNPYKMATMTSARNVFCASSSGAATAASMTFNQTVYQAGEPVICIQFKRDIR